jgi:hypothetical protein
MSQTSEPANLYHTTLAALRNPTSTTSQENVIAPVFDAIKSWIGTDDSEDDVFFSFPDPNNGDDGRKPPRPPRPDDMAESIFIHDLEKHLYEEYDPYLDR